MKTVLVESTRLLIRRTQEQDGPIRERLFCDPTMMHYLGGTWSPQKAASALQEWRQDWGSNNRWYGTLVRRDTGEAIGTAGLTAGTSPDELGATRIVAETHPANPPAHRVLAKAGFARLGERHHHYDYLPGFATPVLWAVTRQ